MSKKISTVIVAEPLYAPGRYCIIRADSPDLDRQHFWCGPSLGWLPVSKANCLDHVLYRSVKEADEDAKRYIMWPLQVEPRPTFDCSGGDVRTRLSQPRCRRERGYQ